jgi:hypothetical protein
MHRFLARSLGVLATASVLLGSAAPAAHAAPSAQAVVIMSFDAAPEPAKLGAPLALRGRVWAGKVGNQSRVELYFQRSGGTTWTPAGFVQSTDRGDFVKHTTAKFSGTWKAVYRGTATRRAAARTDAIQVIKIVPHTVAQYRGTTSTWTSPTVNIPTADYQATIQYQCAGPDGYMFFSWNGAADGYDVVSSSRTSGTLTLNGHDGARNGYFEVDASENCTWSVLVHAGTVRALA